MATYVWSEVRERAVAAFGGELPGAETEAAIIDCFRSHPALVVAMVEAVAEAKRAGRVTSGWAILRARLERAEHDADVVVAEGNDRPRRIARAEQWMRSAGKHYPTAEEAIDELFERGVLGPWRGDEGLRARMSELWETLRGEGEEIERLAVERAEAWRRRRERRKPAAAGEVSDETEVSEDDIPF